MNEELKRRPGQNRKKTGLLYNEAGERRATKVSSHSMHAKARSYVFFFSVLRVATEIVLAEDYTRVSTATHAELPFTYLKMQFDSTSFVLASYSLTCTKCA